MGWTASLIRSSAMACALLYSAGTFAAPYHVAVDLSALGGANVAITYDLVDGGTPANSVAISNFSSDGTLGTSSLSGGVSGGLPSGFTLSDTFFFSEYQQVLSGASALSFDVEGTGNAPDPTSVPDTFAFFLLDPNTLLPAFATTDPTGAGSLFTLEIDGSGAGRLAIYTALPGQPAASWSVISEVPEPGTLWLVAAGIVLAVSVSRQRQTYNA